MGRLAQLRHLRRCSLHFVLSSRGQGSSKCIKSIKRTDAIKDVLRTGLSLQHFSAQRLCCLKGCWGRASLRFVCAKKNTEVFPSQAL